MIMDEMMENLKHGIVSEAIDADALEQFADEQQTVTVKRGRWIERGQSEYQCPFCRKIIFADDQRERNYCPCCGAKMDMDLLEWLKEQEQVR